MEIELPVLLCIKMFHPKVLIPEKNIIVGSNNVRMKKTFGIPPGPNLKEYFSKCSLSI
jgi:hypothetical protein